MTATLSKEEVNYGESAACGNCKMLVLDRTSRTHFTCTLVIGDIELDDICDRYEEIEEEDENVNDVADSSLS